jgi:hypothetical protein
VVDFFLNKPKMIIFLKTSITIHYKAGGYGDAITAALIGGKSFDECF